MISASNQVIANYREIAFSEPRLLLQKFQGAQGDYTIASSKEPLTPYPDRLTDSLIYWAARTPNTTLFAQREANQVGGAASPATELRPWQRISYKQALDSAQTIGAALIARSLDVNRPIVILSGNDLDHAMLALAAQYVGIAYAPISQPYSTVSKDFAKLKQIITLLTPGLVFAADGALYAAAINACVAKSTEIVVSKNPEALRVLGYQVSLFTDLSSDLTSNLSTGPNPADSVQISNAAHNNTGPDTIVRFLFTSGSTGLPKAVINTERMICSNQQMLRHLYPFLLTQAPVLLDWLPWNHTFGGQHNIGLTLFNGGTLYIDDGKPVPGLIDITIANLREIAPTIYFNVPKGYEGLAQTLNKDLAFAQFFFSRVSMLFYAGASMSQSIWDSLFTASEAACGARVPIATGLGMTESAPMAIATQTNDASAGMLGIPCAGMELKLVPNGGKTEVRYRGPNITPGYWRNPETTLKSFDSDGFFITGDAIKFCDEVNIDKGFVFDGRIAEDFKLNTGTWVSVGPLRSRVITAGAPYIQDAVITGIDRDKICAMLIVPWELCRSLTNLPSSATPQQISADLAVRSWFGGVLKELAIGNTTGSASQIHRVLLLTEPLSIDKGEITDKGSVNQRAVLTHRAHLVEQLYAVIEPQKELQNEPQQTNQIITQGDHHV